MTEYITILSIDIGEKNLAIYKERFNINELNKLKPDNRLIEQKYDYNGECCPLFQSYLTKLGNAGERIFSTKINFTADDDKKWGKQRVISHKMLCRLTNYLEDLNQLKAYNNVDYIIIEKQLVKATNNCTIMHHVRAYFIMLFLDFKPIILFNASHKTKVLGAPKKVWCDKKQKLMKLSKYKRKVWASNKAFKILTDRNDIIGLAQIFSNKAKSDDLADCILMNLSFIYLVFINDNTEYLQS